MSTGVYVCLRDHGASDIWKRFFLRQFYEDPLFEKWKFNSAPLCVFVPHSISFKVLETETAVRLRNVLKI